MMFSGWSAHLAAHGDGAKGLAIDELGDHVEAALVFADVVHGGR
jgi:hypothetical protein